MPTKLEQIADMQRAQLITFNSYNEIASNNYGVGHPNAISDGDVKGKGDPTGTGVAGDSVDIATRNSNIGTNKFKDANGQIYNAGHPAALSDGDEHGRGENNGSIGTQTDISTRDSNTSRNLFNENNQYSVI